MKDFLKKHWWEIVNLIILFIIYGVNDGNLAVEVITGLWIFTTLARYFYKWFERRSL